MGTITPVLADSAPLPHKKLTFCQNVHFLITPRGAPGRARQGPGQAGGEGAADGVDATMPAAEPSA